MAKGLAFSLGFLLVMFGMLFLLLPVFGKTGQRLADLLMFPINVVTWPVRWLNRQHVTILEVRGVPTIITGSWFNFILFLTFLGGIVSVSKHSWTWQALYEALPIHLLIAYACVVVHEYGHSITAQLRGYVARDIKLIPFSGLASIEGDWHEKWKDEFWIAVNGPLMNVLMALLVLPFIYIGNEWVNWFFEINVILLAFNMLPIFPMDGGRIMRSLMTAFWHGDWEKATRWATRYSMIFVSIIAPVMWMFWNPVGAILIVFMAFGVGIAERMALNQLQREKRERERLAAELFQEDLLFQEEIVRIIIAETVGEKVPNIILDGIKNMDEEKRVDFNRQYHDDMKGIAEMPEGKQIEHKRKVRRIHVMKLISDILGDHLKQQE